MKSWSEFLEQEANETYFVELMEKVGAARRLGNVYPPEEDMFSCFKLCPYEKTKVVIIGQDPYHRAGQAHGLSFSVKPGQKIPPSLRNMYKELKTDLNIDAPNHGYLGGWAEQGVLMMNTSWSVQEGEAGSHKSYGWATFTKRVLAELNDYPEPLVFILWGNHAQKVAEGVTNPKHYLIKGTHPSPLAANGGFFGSQPFSKANDFLEKSGRGKIDWALQNINS
ncbi:MULTISPECIES: uracil-DNA glycosylase [Listeria]|uniref:uracil-DNA glycosylase n=1 Tax=Listeria TaxID=1637 RepID=UPI000B58E0FE|nr:MULTISPECIES: uracil-DNA glycosylase [Listeria]